MCRLIRKRESSVESSKDFSQENFPALESARGAAVKDEIGRTSEHHGEGGRDGSFIEGQTALVVRGVESSLTIPRPTVQAEPVGFSWELDLLKIKIHTDFQIHFHFPK